MHFQSLFSCCRKFIESTVVKTTSSKPNRNFCLSRTPHKAKQNDLATNPILITGYSGRFPSSNSVEEFKQNLLNGKDMIDEQNRFKVGERLPPRFGFINELDKFDAKFFGVQDKMAQVMDPSLRKLLEVTFETIIDAGINPESLKGSKTGVFVGSDGADATSYWNIKHGKSQYGGYTALGTPTFVLANQVSYLLNLKGTSMTISTGCSSSLNAMETAVNSILLGKCERAIVAATSIHLCSHLSNDLNELGALSPTGECKPFDNSANGFVRGEAIVAILIEREETAKRNYARIMGITTSTDGYKKDGIYFPSWNSQAKMYTEFYKEAKIDPGIVSYIETHGTGTQAGDPQELKGISEAFCKIASRKQNQPLLTGSVKSNMGHGEAAAGLCSVIKILIASQTGIIPRTINFTEPTKSIADLFDGSLKLVTENTIFPFGIVGISSFGIGGTNAHLILETKSISSQECVSNPTYSSGVNLPILVPFSGHEEESLRQSLTQACEYSINPNFSWLLQQIFKQQVPNHSFKGYGIISQSSIETSTVNKNSLSNQFIKIEKSESTNHRPIWLIFPGMGSQWEGMGNHLMKIGIFQESIQNSRVTLKNIGVDLDELLISKNKRIFQNIRDAFNTIAVMQIALYDTLKSIGISPKGYIGHSFGEILCAYADGLITAEETLQIVDARGRAMLEEIKEDSLGATMAMAVIGLSWSEIQNRCSSTCEIFPACHNGLQNVTVSGEESAINDFVKELQNEGIFAKKINSCGVAAHSPFILPASTLYSTFLQQIFKGRGERERTNRWVSTSIPESQWDSHLAKNASPEYFLNNFVNPVLFHEALSHIPKDAIVIEIAPKGILQGSLKASLPNTCTIITPMEERCDKILHFFTSIGDIYNAGAHIDISKLYPPINFPVNAQTPNIGHLIKWNHEQSWIVPILENTEKYVDGVLNIDLEDIEFSYLEGHKLENRLVFPATGYLVFAWKSFASSLGCEFETLPVKFNNVRFKRAVFLNRNKPTQLRCSFQPGEGTFEIHENEFSVVCGNISGGQQQQQTIPNNLNKKMWEFKYNEENAKFLQKDDIYKELSLRDYNFKGNFQSIQRMELDGSKATVQWCGNWITLLDSILQVSLMNQNLPRATYVPTKITSLTLDPNEFLTYVKSSSIEKDSVPVCNKIYSHRTLAPGIELRSVICQAIPKRDYSDRGNLIISNYAFTPYLNKSVSVSTQNLELKQSAILNNETNYSSLATLSEIYLENVSSLKKHIIIHDTFTKPKNSIGSLITQIFSSQPLHTFTLASIFIENEFAKLEKENKKDITNNNNSNDNIKKSSLHECIAQQGKADLIFLDQINLLEPVSKVMKSDAWIILRDPQFQYKNNSKLFFDCNLDLISLRSFQQTDFFLFKKTLSINHKEIQLQTLRVDDKEYNWLPELKRLLSSSSSEKKCSRIYLYSQNNPTNGILGLIKCLIREPNGEKLRCIFDPEGSLNLNFDQPDSILSAIIQQDLIVNVFCKGTSGSYKHTLINKDILTEPTQEISNAKVMVMKPGDLSSLRWIQTTTPLNYYHGKNPHHSSKIVNIYFASLNFKDIMLASGRLAPLSTDKESHTENNLGFEFSGKDLKGNRLMGLARKDALATSIVINRDNNILWKVPENWSLEEAATIPAVYSTAYYSLIVRGKLKKGQSILIHSGTGGVGQAAINIALSMNCQVFTTVGTEEKRKHILRKFPMLKIDNIFSSRSCDFEQEILEITQGRGVDIILNSLAEDKLHASLRCLAPLGTFLEIGKLDIYEDTPVGLGQFLKNITFHAIDLTPLVYNNKNAVTEKKQVYKLVQEGIRKGVVKPLERTVFNMDQVEDAFRFISTGNHIGKVLIQVKQEEENTNRKLSTVKAIPRTYFNQEKTYLIVGGLGGLGLELANWMIQRGAKHLILTSRSGVTNGYQQLCLNRFEKSGVKVKTPKIDLSVYDTAKIFLEDFIKEGKVLGGFFNSGLVIKDSLLENQTEEMFKEVAKPKIKVTKNMDKLTREFCKDHLDYFVTFSSLSAGLGNAGQSNYGFANSAMEQICLQRRKEGFHAASIQWGVIADVGYVAENMKDRSQSQVFDGILPQKVSSCLEVLDALLQRSKYTEETCFSSMIVQDKIGRGEEFLTRKSTLTEAVARLCSIRSQISEINSLSLLNDLGLDSLSGTELQQLLFREHGVQMTTNQVRNLTWGDIIQIEKESTTSSKTNTLIDKSNFTIEKEKDGKDNENDNANVAGFDKQQILIKLNSTNASIPKKNLPLFIVHGTEGFAFPFAPLAKRLNCPVYAFQTGDRFIQKGAPILKMEELTELYIKEIKRVQPKGPYNLSGYSGGASIAYVIAEQLNRLHNEQVNLILLDGYCGFGYAEILNTQNSLIFALGIYKDRLNVSSAETKMLSEQLSSLDITRAREILQEWFDEKFERETYVQRKNMQNFKNSFYTFISIATMISLFTPTNYFKGKVNLITTNDSSSFPQDASESHSFNKFCEAGVAVTIVKGNHYSFLYPENVQETADVINKILIKI